ncbi:chorismate mutase [mine drainage metagenome]|uniref:Chorismate mutase n=1 Tax=mine drainage metagenome TaxID=410659 RepID=T0ZHU8_9ZZZZ
MRDATSGLLEEVRKDILQNTKDLVRLFRERERLSRIVADIKERENVEVRDRSREEIVLKALGDLNPRQKAIINMIFEFTIACENSVDESLHERLSESDLEISGQKSVLEYLASTIVSKPGSEIYSSRELDPMFALGAIRGGAHIINGHCVSPDLRLGHSDNQEKYHISILENGIMKLNPMILRADSSFSRIQVD